MASFCSGEAVARYSSAPTTRAAQAVVASLSPEAIAMRMPRARKSATRSAAPSRSESPNTSRPVWLSAPEGNCAAQRLLAGRRLFQPVGEFHAELLHQTPVSDGDRLIGNVRRNAHALEHMHVCGLERLRPGLQSVPDDCRTERVFAVALYGN